MRRRGLSSKLSSEGVDVVGDASSSSPLKNEPISLVKRNRTKRKLAGTSDSPLLSDSDSKNDIVLPRRSKLRHQNIVPNQHPDSESDRSESGANSVDSNENDSFSNSDSNSFSSDFYTSSLNTDSGFAAYRPSSSNESGSEGDTDREKALSSSSFKIKGEVPINAVGVDDDGDNTSDNEDSDPYGPVNADANVDKILHEWGNRKPSDPAKFLYNLLRSRGYSSDIIEARKTRPKPSQKLLDDYNCTFLEAVRMSDIQTIKSLYKQGVSMNACNQFSESILHHACRRSSYKVVKLMIKYGADVNVVDDYGRSPLHDACWRTETRFDIITLLLQCNLDLLRIADIRGACPISYVRDDQWLRWCAYFYYQKEKFWESKLLHNDDIPIEEDK
jgi:hypothetical protein